MLDAAVSHVDKPRLQTYSPYIRVVDFSPSVELINMRVKKRISLLVARSISGGGGCQRSIDLLLVGDAAGLARRSQGERSIDAISVYMQSVDGRIRR